MKRKAKGWCVWWQTLGLYLPQRWLTKTFNGPKAKKEARDYAKTISHPTRVLPAGQRPKPRRKP